MEYLLNIFNLLKDETTLRIIMLLNKKDLCVCQLVEITGVSQPNISKKLANLRKASLVESKKESLYTFYSLSSSDEILINIIRLIGDKVEKYPTIKNDLIKIKGAEAFLEAGKCS
ncbi:MAG TPA: metalloregulator ArsR/SmtB family transcription factor [Erysipelotrichaceae bacterium]|nr:metalloregulator ArsR/SmtB family transcription factor [Erysipelotrichaceae bacterium]